MASAATSIPALFALDRYMVRRKIFTVMGQKFYFLNEAGQTVAFSKQKAFRLKEDIRLYADESMSRELLTIKARSILDISVTFDVTDATTGEAVGALRRKGLKSILKDEWMILDAHERELGRIVEDSTVMALVRRFITNLIPQSYRFEVNGMQIGQASQNINFFAPKMTVDFSGDSQRALDRRLAVAAIVLLIAVEGRQEG